MTTTLSLSPHRLTSLLPGLELSQTHWYAVGGIIAHAQNRHRYPFTRSENHFHSRNNSVQVWYLKVGKILTIPTISRTSQSVEIWRSYVLGKLGTAWVTGLSMCGCGNLKRQPEIPASLISKASNKLVKMFIGCVRVISGYIFNFGP